MSKFHPRKSGQTLGIRRRIKTKQKAEARGKLLEVPGVPEDVVRRLVDPQDNYHFAEEGRAWLRKVLRIRELV